MTTLNDQNFREELGIEIGNVRMKQKAERAEYRNNLDMGKKGGAVVARKKRGRRKEKE